ncbi:MAG: HAMP domain-containing sensor histidine kinase [Oscillospiraceae bacterium]|nr:HAMP domain-containing sensor histidine kinase [Oscillospiraceae bacterium]
MLKFNKLQFTRNLTIRVKIWLFFMMLVCIVFILMWTFQILLLGPFYEIMKVSSVSGATKKLASAYHTENFTDCLLDSAVRNDMCIEILDKNGAEVRYECMFSGNCMLHNGSNDVYFYFMELRESETGEICRKIYNNTMQSEMLIYGCPLYNKKGGIAGYLITNARLVPVEASRQIMQNITIFIMVLLVISGVILSAYAAENLGAPIKKLNISAQRLAQGDYTVQFPGGGCAEVDDLADTLAYASRELSRTDEMQRDLIANVSHDMRTPLTMMKAYAEMIRDLSGNNPEKRNQHLNIIIEETDRLSLLVNDMLDLSKLESGTQKLDIDRIDISEKLREIARRYEGISEKMGYSLIFTGNAPYIINCDSGKIERVICNLLNNAINYTSKEDRRVYLRQINFPDRVRIEISDTGDGIEEDKIKLIFDKYYRSENHKREVVGTGLGLSIVKAILKMHGYNYGVNSKIGEGSTFWFEAPPADPINDINQQ